MSVTPISSAKFLRKRFYKKYKHLSTAYKCLAITFISLDELRETFTKVRAIIAHYGLCRTSVLSTEFGEKLSKARKMSDIESPLNKLIQGIKDDLKEYASQYNDYTEKQKIEENNALGHCMEKTLAEQKEFEDNTI